MSSWIDDAVIVEPNMSPIPSSGGYSDIIEHMVTKRIENINYIKSTITGENFWMNISKIKFEPQDSTTENQKRIEQWLSLGLSISPLLVCDGRNFIQSFGQLMEEFDYHYSNFAVQGMVRIFIFLLQRKC
jgi:hypothetical protein